MSKNIPPVVTTDLSGKTVLVTGANIGLGLEAAKHFARMNPQKLVITTRSDEKGKTTVAAIEKETGFTRIEARVLELASFESVLSFVEEFKKENASLNILVANAAIALTKYELTPDNWETDVQVNHLSTALLTLLLLPTLFHAAEDSSPSRAVIVSSGVHAWVSFSEDKFPSSIITQLSEKATYSADSQYSYTKLLNVLFTRALAEHLVPSSRVVVDTVNPGFFFSGLRHYNEDQSRFNTPELKAIERTPEEASRQVIYAAIAEEGDIQKFQGAYISDAQIVPPSEWVRSTDGHRAQEKIWAETIDILSKVAPNLDEVLSKHTKQ